MQLNIHCSTFNTQRQGASAARCVFTKGGCSEKPSLRELHLPVLHLCSQKKLTSANNINQGWAVPLRTAHQGPDTKTCHQTTHCHFTKLNKHLYKSKTAIWCLNAFHQHCKQISVGLGYWGKNMQHMVWSINRKSLYISFQMSTAQEGPLLGSPGLQTRIFLNKQEHWCGTVGCEAVRQLVTLFMS